MATSIIGTGGDYTTITAWEAALPATLTEPAIGLLKGEDFSENVTFAGVTTSAANYIELRPQAGAEHRGLSENHNDSPGGIAKVVGLTSGTATILITSVNHVRLLDFEILGGGAASATRHGINLSGSFSGSNIRCLRLLIYNDGGNPSSNSRGIAVQISTANVTVGRCIIYNFGGPGINYTAGTLACNNNTVVGCNRSGVATINQINITATAGSFFNNVACNPNGGKDFTDAPGIPAGNLASHNASSDTTAPGGTNAMWSIVAADNFNDATTGDITLADLRIKQTSPIRNRGTFQTENFAIAVRGNRVRGTWDIGADEYPTTVFWRPPQFRPHVRRPGWLRSSRRVN